MGCLLRGESRQVAAKEKTEDGMKRTFLLAVLLLTLSGCSDYVADTRLSNAVSAPTSVQMKYVGLATTGAEGDPINGCRVYVFRVESYYQTAVYCGTGRVMTASASHQKSDDDDSSAAAAANQ
jgi:hypothetical protein